VAYSASFRTSAEIGRGEASPLIEARDIRLSLGRPPRRVDILHGIDLRVDAGDSVALLGASGSGKSSLLAVLAGLERPSSGSVRVADQDFTALDEDGLAVARRGRIGIEVPAYYLHPHHYGRLKDLLGAALVAEPSNLVHDLKLVKSAAEIALIREAARIADQAMEACVAAFRPNRTELEVAGAVYQTLLTAGSGLPASTINLVSGERLGFSHGAPTLRRIRRGDGGNVELGAAYKRYTATLGRQLSLDPPPARIREIHDIVRAAGDAMIAEIRPGAPAVRPHAAAKRVIAEAGYDRYRIHTSGYGIAPGVPPASGEPLNLFGGSPYTLEAGMMVSVEPPIFIPEERIGARIIDNVLITETGAERLTRWGRELIVINE